MLTHIHWLMPVSVMCVCEHGVVSRYVGWCAGVWCKMGGSMGDGQWVFVVRSEVCAVHWPMPVCVHMLAYVNGIHWFDPVCGESAWAEDFVCALPDFSVVPVLADACTGWVHWPKGACTHC